MKTKDLIVEHMKIIETSHPEMDYTAGSMTSSLRYVYDVERSQSTVRKALHTLVDEGKVLTGIHPIYGNRVFWLNKSYGANIRPSTYKEWACKCNECGGGYTRITANDKQEQKVKENDKCPWCGKHNSTVTRREPYRPKLP